MAKNADYDWDAFDPAAYANHNYRTPRLEDLWLAGRLASFYERLPDGIAVLDVGTGASLVTLLGAIGRAGSVESREFAVSNVAWLRESLGSGALSSHWLRFWAEMREAAPDVYTAKDPLSDLRRLISVEQASIFDLPERGWDVATMFFVAESLTEDLEEFEVACRLLARAVKPGGSIAAAFMEGSVGYDTAGVTFPAVPVGIDDVARAFAPEISSIEISRVPTEPKPVRSGYDGMLLATAVIQ